jgi:hypothetical protein
VRDVANRGVAVETTEEWQMKRILGEASHIRGLANMASPAFLHCFARYPSDSEEEYTLRDTIMRELERLN